MQQTDRSVRVGVSASGDDCAAAVVDASTGRVLFATSEERWSGVPHDGHVPTASIEQALAFARRIAARVVGVAIDFEPDASLRGVFPELLGRSIPDAARRRETVETLVELATNRLDYDARSSGPIRDAVDGLVHDLGPRARGAFLTLVAWHFNWAVRRHRIRDAIARTCPDVPVRHVPHALAHARVAQACASARDTTIVVLDDGPDEGAATVYRRSRDELRRVTDSRSRLGLTAVQRLAMSHLGLGRAEHPTFVRMADAGRPRFVEAVRAAFGVGRGPSLVERDGPDLDDDRAVVSTRGARAEGLSESFHALVARRDRSSPLRSEHLDFAASVQCAVVETCAAFLREAMEGGEREVVLTGTLALDPFIVARVRESRGLSGLRVPHAPGDDGTAIGAALDGIATRGAVTRAEDGVSRVPRGREVEPDECAEAFRALGVRFSSPACIARKMADALSTGASVARFAPSAEFGAHPAGYRAILFDPCRPSRLDTLDGVATDPVVFACIEERAERLLGGAAFERPAVAASTSPPRVPQIDPSLRRAGGTRLTRVVSKDEDPVLHAVLVELEAISGVPIVAYVPFAGAGEALVETPRDAWNVLRRASVDAMAIGPYWIDPAQNLDAIAPTRSDEPATEPGAPRTRERARSSSERFDVTALPACFSVGGPADLVAAVEAVDRGDLLRARLLLHPLHALHPRSPDIARLTALVEDKLGDEAAARQVLDELDAEGALDDASSRLRERLAAPRRNRAC